LAKDPFGYRSQLADLHDASNRGVLAHVDYDHHLHSGCYLRSKQAAICILLHSSQKKL
jgi:hypothetical protein